MFPSEEFWWSAVLGTTGCIFVVLLYKLLENNEDAQREMRGPDDFSESQKRPQEHDERFC